MCDKLMVCMRHGSALGKSGQSWVCILMTWKHRLQPKAAMPEALALLWPCGSEQVQAAASTAQREGLSHSGSTQQVVLRSVESLLPPLGCTALTVVLLGLA